MYLLDTDIIIWISRHKAELIENLKKIVGQDEVGVSTITIAEIYGGIRPTEIQEVNEFLNKQTILQITREIAQQGGLLWQEFRVKFKNISLADCLLAATAKLQNATLVTLNTKHFPMTDVKVISPAEV